MWDVHSGGLLEMEKTLKRVLVQNHLVGVFSVLKPYIGVLSIFMIRVKNV